MHGNYHVPLVEPIWKLIIFIIVLILFIINTLILGVDKIEIILLLMINNSLLLFFSLTNIIN
jgi:hypothetical protein